jgi:hypothetical protein
MNGTPQAPEFILPGADVASVLHRITFWMLNFRNIARLGSQRRVITRAFLWLSEPNWSQIDL